MEAGLQRIVDAGLPFWCGIFASYIAWGGLLVQIPTLFAASSARTETRLKASVMIIFLLTTVNVFANVQRTIITFTTHFGDRQWLSDFHNLGPVHKAGLNCGPLVVLLCHLLLTYRCFSFLNSLKSGSSPVRLAFAGVVTFISIGSFSMGVLSSVTYFRFADYAAIDYAARSGNHLFEISQGAWLGTSLLVDIILSFAISQELFGALRDSKNDVGVGRNLQEVLRTMAVITIRNGLLLVALQVGTLAAFLTSNPGWCSGGLVALPTVQLACLLSYLNTPRQTTRMQRARAQDEEAALSAELTDARLGANDVPPLGHRPFLSFATAATRPGRESRRRKASAVGSSSTYSGKARSSLLHPSSPHLHGTGSKCRSLGSGGRRASDGGVRVETSLVTSVLVLEDEAQANEMIGNTIWTQAPSARDAPVRLLSAVPHRMGSPAELASNARSPTSSLGTFASRERDIGSFTGIVQSFTSGNYDPDMSTEFELRFLSERPSDEDPAPDEAPS